MQKHYCRLFLLTVLCWLGGALTVHAQSSVTLTSYYPVPTGAYDRLRLVPRVAIPGACATGTLYYLQNNTVQVCNNAGAYAPLSPWSQNGGYIYPPLDFQEGNLVSVGIGTETPPFRLSLDTHPLGSPDGGIWAEGTFGQGTTLGNPGAGTRLLWYPAKAAFRAGRVAADQWNDGNIGNYSFAAGYNNQARGYASTITGGQNNLADGNSTTIDFAGVGYTGGGAVLSGSNNSVTAVGVFSSIVSGLFNSNSGKISVIGGGANHVIDAFTWYGTIGGGFQNSIGGTSNFSSGTIAGGSNNTASAAYSTIGGGQLNQASGNNSFIGGGFTNTASGAAATVGGGSTNRATAQTSTVAGGDNNRAGGFGSSVLGGVTNTANGQYSMIGGGNLNVNQGTYSSILGGFQNSIGNAAQSSVILGGSSNAVTGTFSVANGFLVNVSGNNSMGFGKSLTVTGNDTFAFGSNATVSRDNAFVVMTEAYFNDIIRIEPRDNPPSCASDEMGKVYVDANERTICFCDGDKWHSLVEGRGCP